MLKLNDNSSNPIISIQLDQESSGHQYSVRTILKLPSVEIKRSDRCNCDDGDTTGGDSPGQPNKASKYKSKYKKSTLVAIRSISRTNTSATQ